MLVSFFQVCHSFLGVLVRLIDIVVYSVDNGPLVNDHLVKFLVN